VDQEDFLVKGSGPVFAQDRSVVDMHGFVDWPVRQTMFSAASAIIVPSRSEPFGMIILEAMEYGVPVFYAKDAGVGEVLQTDLAIDPKDAGAVAEKVCGLLADERRWSEVVEEQRTALLKFMNTPYEDEIALTWATLPKAGQLAEPIPRSATSRGTAANLRG
jgi:glycosyltransferase involved in cell wall biosynthesis